MIEMENRGIIEADHNVIPDRIGYQTEVCLKMVKGTREDFLNLEEIMVQETKSSFCKEENAKIEPDPKIGEKESMLDVWDVDVRIM